MVLPRCLLSGFEAIYFDKYPARLSVAIICAVEFWSSLSRVVIKVKRMIESS